MARRVHETEADANAIVGKRHSDTLRSQRQGHHPGLCGGSQQQGVYTLNQLTLAGEMRAMQI